MNEIDELIALLTHDADENIRADAAEMLGEIGGAPAIAALLIAFSEPSGIVRVSAALALGELRAGAATEALHAALGDGDANVRGAAVVALGQIGDKAALPWLMEQATDEAAAVRGAVAWALGALRMPQARAALESLCADPDQETAEAAREALRKLGAF